MRLQSRGLIDRTRPVRFTFDGKPVEGFAGDTVASALLGAGVRLMGRSFKYHRPRGVVTAGSEEPNALVTIARGGQMTPNQRATMQEVFAGLDARSQNRWPSLSFDVMELNDWLSPFLGAGFYYKTFMWPRSFWERVYEPAIRRAAGLGALSGQADDTPHDKAFAHCDLLVIGAGPAGLMAALTAARAGVDVILADEDFLPGGRLNAEAEEIGGSPAHAWAAATAAELGAMKNVRLMPRTTVTGLYDGGTYAALERVSEHRADPNGAPATTFWRIAARAAVLATGAIERPIAFAGNDRPGVMNAGAVRAYLNRWGVAAGTRVAVFASNDAAYRTAADLDEAGIDVAAVIDPRPNGPKLRDIRVIRDAVVTGTEGRRGLTAIRVGSEKLEVDALAVSGGWNPSLHLASHTGARPEWRDDIAAFVATPGSVRGLFVAGAANGFQTTATCLSDGVAAARSACRALGLKVPAIAPPKAEDGPTEITPFWHVTGAKGRAWLDFQNDVTVKDVVQAHRENFAHVEHMKRYTTLGMATDQGKMANVGALAIMAELTGKSIPETGTTTFRPPYTPVPIGAMGARAAGKGYAPERRTTSHAFSAERAAPFLEAGLWYRASWFPREGERTWRQSCDREVGHVRDAVGVCDVSTLGKIDIQGPDAPKLLDLVYTNTFSTLPEGRVRYGLMLREDGHVMDDGTAARLGRTHFVMTTTTAAAGEVMLHLDFVTQVLRPDLDVQIISVTEQWAQFAVAGPHARALLSGIVKERIDDRSFPFMACGPVTVAGVKGRLFRISFSGEHAYEIAVPARHGDALMRLLVARAEALGGGAYGMEALNVLRIEKGFITHAEIHGRVTAFDIGMGRMVAGGKDCIGKAMAARPGLIGSAREQLVGVRPVGPVKRLLAGAHLYGMGEKGTRENDQGYLTSVCYSPTLQTMLGLGFLRDGRARHGETLQMIDHLRGIATNVEICDPVFLDPAGGRARG